MKNDVSQKLLHLIDDSTSYCVHDIIAPMSLIIFNMLFVFKISLFFGIYQYNFEIKTCRHKF